MESDFGVSIVSNLSPEFHIRRTAAETNSQLANIRKAFLYMETEIKVCFSGLSLHLRNTKSSKKRPREGQQRCYQIFESKATGQFLEALNLPTLEEK